MISNYDNALEQKWQPVLEGISDAYTRKVTATLLENQAKSIIADRVDEADSPTTVGNLGTFQKFAFPLVRRVFPNLIANQIVGVQPMQGPVSQVFYLGNQRAHKGIKQDVFSKYALTYRNLTATSQMPSGGGAAWASSATTGIYSGAATGNFTDISNAAGSGMGFQSPTATVGGKIASWPLSTNYMGAWCVSAGEVLSGDDIPELTMNIQQQPVTAVTRKMRALWTIEAAQDLKAYHNLDLESELTGLLSKEMALEIDRELIEDLRMIAYNVDSAAGGWKYDAFDLGNSNNIQGGFNTLVKAGNGTEVLQSHAFTWGHSPTTEVAASSFACTSPASTSGIIPAHTITTETLTTKAQAGIGRVMDNVFIFDMSLANMSQVLTPRHIGHVYANLLATINFVSQDIYKTTLRGPANFILTSPVVASMLESAAKLEGGIRVEDGPTNLANGGIEFRGKFMGRYDLLVDPLFPDDEIIMGYKGPNALDAGLVYAPYIPLQALPNVTDPNTFQPRKGIITRYGKVVIAPAHRFYRVIRLVNHDGTMVPPMANRLRTA
jgi:hypothetical protein